MYFLFRQSGKGAARKAQRATAGAAGAGANKGMGGSNGILRFYAEDSPGLQLGPTQVLVMSVSFVGIVVLLHIWGKFNS
jgi:protein transport protein SEC61 subunit beta